MNLEFISEAHHTLLKGNFLNKIWAIRVFEMRKGGIKAEQNHSEQSKIFSLSKDI